MSRPVISATGLYTPPHSISNAELVASSMPGRTGWNAEHAEEITAGKVEPKPHSSVEFIEKASGIKSRYVVDKDGVLDPKRMRPIFRAAERPDFGAGRDCGEGGAGSAEGVQGGARRQGNRRGDLRRVEHAARLSRDGDRGTGSTRREGFAFDMNVACSSATFGIQTAADFVRAGHAKTVLMVNPEICSGHLNFTDRDSHFIFGDVATAVLVEAEEIAPKGGWSILGTHLKTQFSNNIRNNFGFLNRGDPDGVGKSDKLFVQEGRKVFKEVVPMVAAMINEEMDRLGIAVERAAADVAAPGQCRHEPPDRRARAGSRSKRG
jgi:beta-ketodecanoyl-[acyl-carrier-protein] synthase